jgi:hypothetical protein
MRLYTPAFLVSCITLAAASVASAGTVTVSFADSPGFSDAGSTPWDKEANLRALTQHLQALGKRYLPADQVLKVELLDVDLAGTMWPARRAGPDLRIVRGGADWPRINLRYSLAVNDKPLRSGQDSLYDLNYLHRFTGARSSDPLHAEKQMLEDWFKARFVEGRAAGG